MIETPLPLDIANIVGPTGQLLPTKLYAPRLRSNRVSRPRLITRLNQNFDQRKLTLISAPTGFGKTTLLSEWLYSKSEVRSEDYELNDSSLTPFNGAWLSLGKDDNDPVRFLTYVVAALQTAYSAIGETSLAILLASQPPPLEAALTALVNELAAVPDNCALVLDD
jgi:LuxR family maltose regulon positive regulatory protein